MTANVAGTKGMEEVEPPSYHSAVPPFARSGDRDIYENSQNSHRLYLSFWPDVTKKRRHQEWVGSMTVKCYDVPQLMREGFFWAAENVLDEHGYIQKSDQCCSTCKETINVWNNGTWADPFTRHFILRDVEYEPPRWVAEFLAHAATRGTLGNVRLDQLSVRNIRSAYATSGEGRFIYKWQRGKPELTFNAIYNHMPMEGWWPWPRNDAEGDPAPGRHYVRAAVNLVKKLASTGQGR